MTADTAAQLAIIVIIVVSVAVGFLIGATWRDQRARRDADARVPLAYRCTRGGSDA